MKTLLMTLVNTLRQTLFRAVTIEVRSPTMGFCSKGEKLHSAPNTTRESGNLDAWSRVRGITKGSPLVMFREHQWSGKILVELA